MSHVWLSLGIWLPFPDLPNNTIGHYFPFWSVCLPDESLLSHVQLYGSGFSVEVAIVGPGSSMAKHCPIFFIKCFPTMTVLMGCRIRSIRPPSLSVVFCKNAWLTKAIGAFCLWWLRMDKDVRWGNWCCCYGNNFSFRIPIPIVVGE